MKHKVLWIEDGAFAEMQFMSAPIYVSGEYDLVIALNATEGFQYLAQKEKRFETIIVDIRLPPGDDEEFTRLFNNRAESKAAARLGLALLKRVIDDGERFGVPKHHCEPERFGIFTVEGPNELAEDLKKLRITVCHQKTELNKKTEVIEIIEEIRKSLKG
jgi:hypothetical protein